MNNSTFKGEYLINSNLLKEASCVVNKKIVIIHVFLSVLSFLVGIREFIYISSVLGTILVMLGLFIFLLLYIIINAPKNQIKAIKLKYHKDAVLSEVNFIDNAIVVHDKESGGTYQFYYNQLMKCFETKNLCVLVLGLPKTVLYVSKDSIEGGDKDELIKFIEGKIEENLKAKKKK